MCHAYHPTLFVSPTRGGILQGSGFLDLSSLIALSQTCKAHALDAQSLILLIENDLTQCHRIETMEEAIDFLKRVFGTSTAARRWLFNRGCDGDDKDDESLFEGWGALDTRYDVMLFKVLRVKSETERLKAIEAWSSVDGTCLVHEAATAGNFESVRVVLDLVPESERVHLMKGAGAMDGILFNHAVRSMDIGWVEYLLGIYPESERMQVLKGQRLVYFAVASGDIEWIRTMLELYPESERLNVLDMRNPFGGSTALHRAIELGNPDVLKFLLSLYPESERRKVVSRRDKSGSTLLHDAASSSQWILLNSSDTSGIIECINTILSLYPESERLEAIGMKDEGGRTVLHRAACWGNPDAIKCILSLCPESERLQALSLQSQHGETVSLFAARLRYFELSKYILTLFPDSHHKQQAVSVRDQEGCTIMQRGGSQEF